MIIKLTKSAPENSINEIIEFYDALHFTKEGQTTIITSSSVKKIKNKFEPFVEDLTITDSDIQLSSKAYKNSVREINLGPIVIGGNTNNTVLISGPCSVESREQIFEVAEKLVSMNIKIIRAGCFKPRTSPYSFQGLGKEGIDLLKEVKNKYGLSIITEVRDFSHFDLVLENTDILQIGAKAMYDHGILKNVGKTSKPVLLKRGFGTTLKEFVQAAEFILSGGNENVILCERGIRTFETGTRFTLDLCGVAFLKEYTNLPIVLDPSHALGYSYGVPILSQACVAMQIDGMLIESHPDPSIAKSDASQQLPLNTLESFKNKIEKVANSVGYNIV